MSRIMSVITCADLVVGPRTSAYAQYHEDADAWDHVIESLVSGVYQDLQMHRLLAEVACLRYGPGLPATVDGMPRYEGSSLDKNDLPPFTKSVDAAAKFIEVVLGPDYVFSILSKALMPSAGATSVADLPQIMLAKAAILYSTHLAQKRDAARASEIDLPVVAASSDRSPH